MFEREIRLEMREKREKKISGLNFDELGLDWVGFGFFSLFSLISSPISLPLQTLPPVSLSAVIFLRRAVYRAFSLSPPLSLDLLELPLVLSGFADFSGLPLSLSNFASLRHLYEYFVTLATLSLDLSCSSLKHAMMTSA